MTTSPRVRQFLQAVEHATPEALAEQRAQWSEPRALALLADESWWSLALPLYAAALEPFFTEPYGRTVAWAVEGVTHEAHVAAAGWWRHDAVVVELVLGLAARLSASSDPAVELLGLRAQAWLGAYLADLRRQAPVVEALGVERPFAQFPGCMPFAYLIRPHEELVAVDAEGHRFGGDAIDRLPDGYVIPSILRSALGDVMIPLPSWRAGSPRPWLWCWELESAPPGVVRVGDDGRAVPVPVVVPADWADLAAAGAPDRYGFAAEAEPGVTLVVDDLERVRAAWGRRFDRQTGRGAPARVVEPTVEPEVGQVFDVSEARGRRSSVRAVPSPSAEPAPAVELTDAERADAAREAAFAEVVERFEPWRRQDGWRI